MTIITVTHEDNEIDEFQFDAAQRTITLGRRAANDVCIPDLSVSGNHAQITLHDDRVVLQDLNSTNGSYVNGQVIQSANLAIGDEIILGKILLNVTSDALSASPGRDELDSASAPASAMAEQEALMFNDEVPFDEPENALSQHAVSRQDAAGGSHSLQDVSRAQPLTDNVAERASAFAADSAADKAADMAAGIAAHGANDESDVLAPESMNASSHDDSHLDFRGDSQGDTSLAHRPAVSQAPQSKLKPQNKSGDAHPLDGLEHLVVPAAKPAATPMHELDSPSSTSKGAVIEIKNGAKSGQILPIDKPVTTLGRPGIQIAAIMRKPDGYFVMHIESDGNIDKPTLNSDIVGDDPVLLHSGDKLTVAGIAVEFMLS